MCRANEKRACLGHCTVRDPVWDACRHVYIVIGIIALVFFAFFLKFFGLWFRALLSGASIKLGRLVGMWIRRVKSVVIVDSRIMLTKAGLQVDSDLLETHYLAGGDVLRVSKALTRSMKKAQTRGTMMKARCEAPYLLVTAAMLAMAVGVDPREMPPKPAETTAAS